jgi:hypothetical protein
MRSTSRLVSRCAVVGAAALACLAPTLTTAPLAQGTAQDHVGISAVFTGVFVMDGENGQSSLFTVQESGTGEEASLGEYDYTVAVQQNASRPPASCPTPNSSTGAGGTASITLEDGTLSLRRRSGEACFAFPNVRGTETWVVSNGTDRYRGASGALTREFTADVRFGTLTGTWTGSVVLPPDQGLIS